jgi:hypothetical protein
MANMKKSSAPLWRSASIFSIIGVVSTALGLFLAWVSSGGTLPRENYTVATALGLGVMAIFFVTNTVIQRRRGVTFTARSESVESVSFSAAQRSAFIVTVLCALGAGYAFLLFGQLAAGLTALGLSVIGMVFLWARYSFLMRGSRD